MKKPSERSELFLSCDLVGSTAYKQRQLASTRTNDANPDNPEDGSVWQQTFMDFYRTFPQVVGELETTANGRANPDNQVTFELWKPIGDELIFTVHVANENQVAAAVHIWLRALDTYAESLVPFGMSTKGAAFIATFPGPDSEVAVPRTPGRSESQDENVILLNDDALKRRAPRNYVYDYFGPSIDTGFRIASQATPRYFPISVEVAHALLISQRDDEERWSSLVYRGGHEFKGVWNGRDYPLFAVDRHHLDDVNKAVRSLTKSALDAAAAVTLCIACMNEPNWPSHIYLPGSDHQPFKTTPRDPLQRFRNNSEMSGAERLGGSISRDLGNEELPDNATIDAS